VTRPVNRRDGMRERWIAAVLATDKLKPGCKNVLWALSRQMTDRGRVTYPRAELAADLGVRSVQRISDRIKEAKAAGFLSHFSGGVNGTVATYDAMIPASELARLRATGRSAGFRPRGRPTRVAEPAGASGSSDPEPGNPTHARQRAPCPPRATRPAPDGSRGPAAADPPTSNTTNGGAIPATLPADSSWIPPPQARRRSA
jgi:hypothetical protein